MHHSVTKDITDVFQMCLLVSNLWRKIWYAISFQKILLFCTFWQLQSEPKSFWPMLHSRPCSKHSPDLLVPFRSPSPLQRIWHLVLGTSSLQATTNFNFWHATVIIDRCFNCPSIVFYFAKTSTPSTNWRQWVISNSEYKTEMYKCLHQCTMKKSTKTMENES